MIPLAIYGAVGLWAATAVLGCARALGTPTGLSLFLGVAGGALWPLLAIAIAIDILSDEELE